MAIIFFDGKKTVRQIQKIVAAEVGVVPVGGYWLDKSSTNQRIMDFDLGGE